MEYKEDQLTEWFDIEKQKPWGSGVYQVESDFGYCTGYATSYWDGYKWHFTCNTPADAYKHKELPTRDNIVKWRGLNSNPSATKKKANKRKTMYVVMEIMSLRGYGLPLAVFEKKSLAKIYINKEKSMRFHTLFIKTIRFRTPEA